MENTNQTADYIPYGDAWAREMKKLPKDLIIEMFKKAKTEKQERFKMPTDDQLIKFALLFTEQEGLVDNKIMADAVAMCQLILDRLHENGDVLIKSKEELQH